MDKFKYYKFITLFMERKLQKISNSLLITLPQEWTKENKLLKGSKLNIEVKDNNLVISSQPIKIEKEEIISVINYNSSFVKIFLRDYVNGVNTIKVKNISKNDVAKIQDIIKNLVLNAQIIDEKKDEIIIKIFETKEFDFSMCLKRIINIISSIFEDILNQDIKDVRKRDEILGQFYYLLLRQISYRMTYYSNESLQLLKMWLCAEKLEFIGDMLKRINKLNKNDLDYAKNVYDFYKKVINAFIKNDVLASQTLWQKRIELSKENYSKTETSQYLQMALVYVSFINNLI